MKAHERLAENERHLRCSAMDAVEVFCSQRSFQNDDCAVAHVGFLRLPSGNKVGLIDIRFDSPERRTVASVSLPVSTHFNAIPDNLPVSRRFEIERLNKARINGRGRVRLADGTNLRALEVEPVFLPIKPTKLDWRIVHLTLEFVDAKSCYRSLREDFPPERWHMVPDLYFLDGAHLSGLSLPPLKDIIRFIAGQYRHVSGQQIANALRKFGIRHPQARPA